MHLDTTDASRRTLRNVPHSKLRQSKPGDVESAERGGARGEVRDAHLVKRDDAGGGEEMQQSGVDMWLGRTGSDCIQRLPLAGGALTLTGNRAVSTRRRVVYIGSDRC